jgi:hypothetical protein
MSEPELPTLTSKHRAPRAPISIKAREKQAKEEAKRREMKAAKQPLTVRCALCPDWTKTLQPDDALQAQRDHIRDAHGNDRSPLPTSKPARARAVLATQRNMQAGAQARRAVLAILQEGECLQKRDLEGRIHRENQSIPERTVGHVVDALQREALITRHGRNGQRILYSLPGITPPARRKR